MALRSRHARSAALAALTLCAVIAPVHGQERYVQDIQVSRTDSIARVVVELACPMRFLADNGGEAGVVIEVRIAPFDSCRQLGLASGITSEAYRPVGGQLAFLNEVEYESLGLGDSFLFFRFDRAVSYTVSQQADLRQIVLAVDLDEAPAPSSAAPPVTAPALSQAPRPAAIPSGRAPLSARGRPPQTAADYVVNLQSTEEPVEQSLIESLATPAGSRVYVSQTRLNGKTWYRLRIGFFESEAQAGEALEPLQAAFPRAWIGRAEPEEIGIASSTGFQTGDVVAEPVSAEAPPTPTAAPRGTGTPSLAPERVAELMADARNALLDRRYQEAVRLYAQLLLEPGDHQQEARENLGIAHERLGQLDQASAEYRAYLREYPGVPETTRIQQRLEGVLTAAVQPRESLRRSLAGNAPGWDLVSGVSQYYRRDVDRLPDAQEDRIGLSALQSDIDFSARRTGGRYDMLSRISASHFYDLIGEENGGPGDQTRVTYAYYDIIDTQRDWSARLGRQTLHNFGVLGRFDGAHFAYGWRPDQRIHVTAGYPVDSTRDELQTDRRFFGVATDFDKLLAGADLSVFVNQQRIEGIDARQAVGAEVHYAGENGNFTGVVDYDVGFAQLNSVMLLGAWRLPTDTTVSGLIDVRLSPILTTRNALIGQPTTTIDELLLVWTEDEIRQLAVDRTAETRTFTIGASQPLGERFQANVDLTMTEIDGTVASGGVAAIPGTGKQTYLTTSLVGTGLFGEADVNMLNVRYGKGDEFATSYLTWDARFPIGRRIRLNPRLRYAVRDGLRDDRSRETVSLGLRMLFTTRQHFRFEFEVGADSTQLTEPTGSVDSTGYYLDLGYRASF